MIQLKQLELTNQEIKKQKSAKILFYSLTMIQFAMLGALIYFSFQDSKAFMLRTSFALCTLAVAIEIYLFFSNFYLNLMQIEREMELKKKATPEYFAMLNKISQEPDEDRKGQLCKDALEKWPELSSHTSRYWIQNDLLEAKIQDVIFYWFKTKFSNR